MSTESDAPTPSIVLFARGVIAILNTWPVLRLAVEEGWGGPESAQKRRWLAGAVVDEFQTPSGGQIPDAPYVEEMLLQVMQDEFEIDLDDDSGAEISQQIVRLWANGDVQREAVEALEVAEQRGKGRKIVAQRAPNDDDSDSESGEDDEDEEVDDEEAPQLVASSSRHREEPEVDEEGFTMVKKGGRGAR